MHLCIVNLVIGTLYCSKGNIEFGVRLVMRALDPVSETLGTDTWLYAKRCLLGLIEKVITNNHNPQPLGQEIFAELMIFLEAVAGVGKDITSAVLGGSQAGRDATSSLSAATDSILVGPISSAHKTS
jgi:tetratricopeptide repeat protein 30